ncbi:MAG: NmrA family NAD(P)-binding protein [Bacteroidales bacterium]|nr:NmrA family NAD(P)-binding protein [Bacteroidales bacterium]
MKYFITGATGSVGRQIVNQLVEQNAEVTAMCRVPENSNLPKEVQAVKGDLTDGNINKQIFEGVETIFLFPAEGDIRPFLRTVKEAGVRHVIALSSLAVSAHFQRDLNSFSNKYHLAVENAVREAGLKLTALRSGTFANNLLAWAPTIKMTRSVFLPFPDSAQALIHEADIADCVVALFAQPAKWGKVYELSGPKAITQREQVEKIGQALGVPLNCHRVTTEQFTSSVSQFMSTEIIKMILTYWEETTLQPDMIRTGYTEITGKTGRSFEQWAEDHVGQFR